MPGSCWLCAFGMGSHWGMVSDPPVAVVRLMIINSRYFEDFYIPANKHLDETGEV